MEHPASEWPLVGRAQDLARGQAAVRRGDVDVLLIAGPGGVGKSRLARELARIGGRLGLRTAQALATEAASSVPLGALAPLFPDGPAPVAEPGDDLGWAVERLLSGRAGGGGSDHGDAEADAGDRGDADGHGVTSSGSTSTRRLLLVVDDAPLLDEASAQVVRRVAEAGEARLVLTARTELHDEPAMATICQGLQVERLELGPLSRDEVVDLAAAGLGGPVDGACGQDLWAASRGNPLFLRELVLGALASQVLQVTEGRWRLSGPLTSTPRLTELIGARLVGLDDESRTALQLLALGEPLEATALGALGIAPNIVKALEARALVASDGDGSRVEVRLAHPMYGEALRHDLTAINRLTASRRLADTFEAAGVRPSDVLRVAVWRLEGGGPVDHELMLEGARRAYFARQTDLAEQLAREAIAAGAPVEAGVLLAQVLGNLGRHDERYDLLGELELAAPTQELRALVTMDRALCAFWGLNRGDEARAALHAAGESLHPGPWRDEVVAQRATLELLSGNPQRALTLATPLLEAGTGRPMVTAAVAAAPALAICGRGDHAVELADRGLVAQLDLGEQEVMTDVGVHVMARALGLIESGRLDEAGTTLEVAYDVAVGGRNVPGQAWCGLMRGRLALVTGQLQTADEWFREGATQFARLAQDGPRRWCVAGMVLAAAQRADPAGAADALAELDRIGGNVMQMMETDVLRARAWEAAARADVAAACDQLVEAATRAEIAGMVALAAAAWHDLARLGHPERAAPALAALAPPVEARIDGGSEEGAEVEGPRVAAQASHAAALADHDVAALEATAERFEAMGAVLLAAEALAAASALLRRSQRSQRAAALGRRAAALRARCEGARTPALDLLGRAAQLTPREREVAVLAGRGMESRAIAERLAVSVRTVESHLERAYAKLGISSREALAEALAPDGDDLHR